ncbi:tumor necrosis factor-inducible gene 6 protein [Elysia marginata]|uniref:Tumor necrosis factor-inducible gene 6 protein n=1 Tax=Elysia marginata TaxID=1093978 RepID=A0AAV4GQ72_9GAST|nr:tumor necrosis factor-inducible gene 6 protein [Elysia marginata]
MERQCGGTIQLSSVPTRSLVLVLTENLEYPALFDCHVTVVVTEEARIHLSFLKMDIRSYGACSGDFVTIIDSRPLSKDTFSFQDRLSRRHCGVKRPEPIASSGNNVTIRFVSDAHVNGHGFSLLLTAFHEGNLQAS